MRRISKKQAEYRKWIDEVARPFVIERDGVGCRCAGCPNIGTDLDHILGVGSHPQLKRDLENLQLLCRWPCHFNKTNLIECIHA